MNVVVFDVAAATARLADLERREAEISRLRRKLHERLDTFPNEPTRHMERTVSDERRALHREIDALRGQIEAAAPAGEARPPD